MKEKIGKYLLAFAAGAALSFFVVRCNQETKIVKVPVEIEVKVPSKEGKIDTIYQPKPYKVIDTITKDSKELINKYEKAKDSIKKLLYKDAIAERIYNETLKDSFMTGQLYIKTRGTLEEYTFSYKTKPYTLKIDTIIPVEIPIKRSLILSGEIGMPTNYNADEILKPVFKINLDFVNKKNWLYGGGFDTQQNVYLKIGKKFDF